MPQFLNFLSHGIALISRRRFVAGRLVIPLIGAFFGNLVERFIVLVQRFGEVGNVRGVVERPLQALGHRFQCASDGVG